MADDDTIDLSHLNTCENCGKKIEMIAYMGTGLCSGNCEDDVNAKLRPTQTKRKRRRNHSVSKSPSPQTRTDTF